MEVLCTDGKPFSKEMSAGKDLLELCLQRLKRKPPASRGAMHVPVKATIEIEEDEEKGYHFEKHQQFPSSSFVDIIGCEKAKQSLRENIVFHLSLPHQMLRNAFTG